MLAGQAALVALAVARDVHRVALLQLRDLLLDLVPPAHPAPALSPQPHKLL